MTRAIPTALAALLIAASAGAASAQVMQDETRDRVLLVHQSRGTLAPGTAPKCFPSNVDDTVAGSQYQCPTARRNGQPRYPTARSFWGVFGGY